MAVAYTLRESAIDLFHRGAYDNALCMFAISPKSVECDIGILACHYELGSFQRIWEMYLSEYSGNGRLHEFLQEWDRVAKEGL